jgi:hypothetical protein
MELAIKVIRINHKNNSITLIGEYEFSDEGRDEATMAAYLDRADEPSPDKDYGYTWSIITTYYFNTTLPRRDNK